MYKQEITAILIDFRDTQRFALMTLLAATIYLLFCAPVMAGPLANVLCSVISMVMLDVGRAIATLAVIALGIGAMLGKATWGQGLVLISGIGIMFGGPPIALALFTGALAGPGAGTLTSMGGLLTTGAAMAACSTELSIPGL